MLPFPSFLAPASVGAGLLNRLLSREPWARERLQRHAGKTVRFDVGGFRVSLCLQSDGLVQVSDPAIIPDVTLTLPASKLGKLPGVLASSEPDDIVELLHIQGDAGLAHTVADLARTLRFDAEDELASVVGDVAAVRLTSGAQTLAHGVRRAGTRLSENISEYLIEESRQVLGRGVFDEWRNSVHAMETRLRTLEQRIERLEQFPHSGGRAA